MSRVVLALSLLSLTGILGGCVGGSSESRCILDLMPDIDDARPAVPIPEETLAEHAAFRAMIERADRHEGVGMAIACEEGKAIMDDLADAGATLRRFDEVAADTMVSLDGEPYHLLLGRVVSD